MSYRVVFKHELDLTTFETSFMYMYPLVKWLLDAKIDYSVKYEENNDTGDRFIHMTFDHEVEYSFFLLKWKSLENKFIIVEEK